MSAIVDLNNFCQEFECTYDGERYSVRDNGAVFRHSRPGKRPRPTDQKWTFGKPNDQNGYMYISQVRIHRIVATAFHGEPPSTQYVVDHIDTNRRNNRPENLRWLTRLENALLNPVTVKRIEFICGSIEAFLKDPSILRHGSLERNFEWMRTVTPEEAQACQERMQIWAKSEKPSSGTGSLGEWLYKPLPPLSAQLNAPFKVSKIKQTIGGMQADQPVRLPEPFPEESDLVISKTPGAVQRDWRTPTEFPYCPQDVEGDPIVTYAQRLGPGVIFSRNHFTEHRLLEAAITDEGKSLCVMCEQTPDAIKPWSLAKVTFEDGLYVHTNLHSYFSKEGAERQFYLARGLEWTGADSIDDYC